jgi:hypothetical protein
VVIVHNCKSSYSSFIFVHCKESHFCPQLETLKYINWHKVATGYHFYIGKEIQVLIQAFQLFEFFTCST